MSVEMKTRATQAQSHETGMGLYLRTPFKSPTRKMIFTLHKWLGAIVALWLLTMSLSGVSLVFRDELEELLNPPHTVSVGEKRAEFEKLIENMQKHYAGYKVTGLICPRSASHPIQVFAANDQDKKIALNADPYTGEILGLRRENEFLASLADLHHNLFNGKTGRAANGIGALCVFTLVVSGVIVWWRGIKDWTSGFRFSLKGNFRRVNWNMHSAFGVWSLPLLLIWSISGFYFGFTGFFEKSLNVVFPVSAQKQVAPPDEKIALEDNNQPPSMAIAAMHSAKPNLDKMVQTAIAAAPREDFVERIAFPDKRRPTLRIWLCNSLSADDTTKTQVFLDPKSGDVLSVAPSNAAPTGDVILQWLTRLHFGNFWGIASKSIWIFAGLTPAILAVSGLSLFMHGLTHRRSKR
ncbi:MAG TPA: PepSY-associated TM helix domain-containing protein [Candidatus Melainabacteria bacterium]|nr:PepSY-associated TM helix domain-containing protein [Candidatus Melainabacteria bacterium]